GCPWETKHRLVRIGLKGKEISHDKRPASNLVFLVDVSGSMEPANKLPLVKRGLTMLTGQLTENDRVAMVVYAGSSGLVLPGTTGDQKGTIIGAIEALGAGGSTNGAGGIERAYEVAAANFIKGGVNRVILCTDGDFNVGITDQGALTRLIEEKAKTGVFLSVLGFGMGNLKDATMEQLADKGNGNYAYVDTPAEARKVLVEQMAGTLVTIAKDVKVQVEFNPAVASAYRLIGYENRVLAKEDFNDDKKDAGEIGAGHTVTALYEVVPAGTDAAEKLSPQVDALKYQKPLEREPTGSGELLTLKLRYKEPEGETSKLLEFPVTDGGASYAKASGDYKFAAAVSAFGMILRDSPHKGSATLPGVTELAAEGLGKDENGYRAEFIGLVEKARRIKEAQGSSAHAIPGAPSEG
ncbi:MAG TPA: YfbK domain-containing protein, partial [Tepidisphaeraceae bacterium]|nr:YfbK domain-containing protein [Tepidisphaeraceae bacterium]